MNNCPWVTKSKLEELYHDTEWGIVLHDEQKLFELLMLIGQHAGLSWHTILQKRQGLREAYHHFDPYVLSRLNETDVDTYMFDSRVIKNRLKINAIISNARAYLKLIEKYCSLDFFIWRFTDFKRIENNFEIIEEVPTKTDLSDLISTELKKLGFKFVGSTTVYAFMQSIGMVNDHITSCIYHKRT